MEFTPTIRDPTNFMYPGWFSCGISEVKVDVFSEQQLIIKQVLESHL